MQISNDDAMIARSEQFRRFNQHQRDYPKLTFATKFIIRHFLIIKLILQRLNAKDEMSTASFSEHQGIYVKYTLMLRSSYHNTLSGRDRHRMTGSRKYVKFLSYM